MRYCLATPRPTPRPASKLLQSLFLAALSLFAAWTAAGTAAEAQDYPWCANYTKGSTSCSFVTFEQCMADVSGIGGFCERNTWYHPAAAPARQRPRALSKSN
jgi:hypothetical protein